MKILCVGIDSLTLRTRIAVLEQFQFEAFGCSLEEVCQVLASGRFDVVLLPADIRQNQLSEICEKANGSAVVVLEAFTFPNDLINLIHRAKALTVSHEAP